MKIKVHGNANKIKVHGNANKNKTGENKQKVRKGEEALYPQWFGKNKVKKGVLV